MTAPAPLPLAWEQSLADLDDRLGRQGARAKALAPAGIPRLAMAK